MNADLHRELRTQARRRASEHPADLDGALRLGIQQLRRRLLLWYAAAVAVVVVPLLASAVAVGYGWPAGGAAVTSISVGPEAPSLGPGERLSLSVTAGYSDGTSEDVTGRVAWSLVPDPGGGDVVALDGSGTVTALGPGAAVVTAEFEGKEASTTVTVRDEAVEVVALAVTPVELAMEEGDEHSLTATARYSDGTSGNVTADAEWTVLSEAGGDDAVSVDDSGVVTALAPGSSAVAATFEGQTASATVTVLGGAAGVVSLEVEPAGPVLDVGGVLPLTATAGYSDGTKADATTGAEWTVLADPDGEDAVQVDGAGRVTALGPGSSVVTASFEGRTASTTVTVRSVTAMEIAPAEPVLDEGAVLPLSATAYYSDGSSAIVTTGAQWAVVPDPDIGDSPVVVDGAGLVTALASGSSTVTVTFEGQTASTTVTVAPAVVALEVVPAELKLEEGQDGALSATAWYSDGTFKDVTTQVTWSVVPDPDGEDAATVDESGGVVGLVSGSSKVTATFRGYEASATVEVVNVVD